MKKNIFLLALCFIMVGQFTIVLVSGPVEHHPLPTLHAGMGLALMACSTIHLFIHRGGIKMALTRFSHLSEKTRTNSFLNFILLAGYMACGATGLLASRSPAPQLIHLHLISALSVVILQAIHLIRHRRWIQSMTRNLFAQIIPAT